MPATRSWRCQGSQALVRAAAPSRRTVLASPLKRCSPTPRDGSAAPSLIVFCWMTLDRRKPGIRASATRLGASGVIGPQRDEIDLQNRRLAALAPSERRILALIITGKSDTAIAAHLDRSVHTVRTIAKSIREKFGVHRMDDIVRGIETGAFTIRNAEDRFNLGSAQQVLEKALEDLREIYLRGKVDRSRNVRLHELEMLALLAAAGEYGRAEHSARDYCNHSFCFEATQHDVCRRE
jgi:DNA-binding CsgD family transcriptional regulator